MIFTYYQNKESLSPTYFLMWELPELLISGSTKATFERFKAGEIAKEELPIIIASGHVKPGRKTNENVSEHSGLILLDLDKKDNLNIEKKIRNINSDPLTYFSFQSPNGGYKVGVYTSISSVEEHLVYYDAISTYYSQKFDITCDKRCRNIARFCFLPYDENYFYNPLSERFTVEKGTSNVLLPQNNLKKRDKNTFSTPDPNSTDRSCSQKRDISTLSTSDPKSNLDSKSEKRDNTMPTTDDPISGSCSQKRDNSMLSTSDPNYSFSSGLNKGDNSTYITNSTISGSCSCLFLQKGDISTYGIDYGLNSLNISNTEIIAEKRDISKLSISEPNFSLNQNLEKRDISMFSTCDPKSYQEFESEKRDISTYNKNNPQNSLNQSSQKGDISMLSTYGPNFSLNQSLEMKDNSGFNESDNDICYLIKKGTYACIIFNNTRYINIMCAYVPFSQLYSNPRVLDYSTRIDEKHFSGDCLTYYVPSGIPVCQIRTGKVYRIKTGNRNKTLGSFCLKLIFNNPFTSCERIQKEILNLNEKLCDEPLSEKECQDIVRYNYEKFLRGELDFSKVIRQNSKGISKQHVFFSRKYAGESTRDKHGVACKEYRQGKKTSTERIILDAIQNLQDCHKITIKRMAQFTGLSEKTIDRNLTAILKEKYKDYNKSVLKKFT